MNSLVEESYVAALLQPVSLSSVVATDIINMENYDKVTFIVQSGSVGTGGNISIRQMDAVTDTVSTEDRFDLDFYWEATAGTGTFTKTTADTISSFGGVTVADAEGSKIWVFEVRAEQLAAGNTCVALYNDTAGAASMLLSAIGVCHKSRYKAATPPNAFSA